RRRAGKAHPRRNTAARSRTPRTCSERCRTFASAIGSQWAGDRLHYHDPGRTCGTGCFASGGRHDLYRTTEAMNEAAQRVRRYLTRRLIVNMSCSLPIGIGLTMIGIPHAALWAIFVVLLRFIPYLGIVIAACSPFALATAVDPGWTLLLWTISLFVVVELIVANFVEPWVYGSGAGL